MIIIEKRNGDKVPFDKQKIINAVNGAFIEVDGRLYEDDTARDIADDIENNISSFSSNKEGKDSS